MSAPSYNPATDTVVFVGDSNDPGIADITAAGAAPLGTAPRIITHPSPASNSGTITPQQQIVTGKNGVGKALSMLYPTGATKGYSLDFIVCNPAVPPTDPTLTHYIRFACEFTIDGDGSTPLPIKFLRFLYPEAQGGSAPQFSTHYRVAMQSGAPDHVTYWQYVYGGDDPEHNQATQPVAPYYVSLVNQYNDYVIEFRTHSTEKEADGVTPATISFTPSSPGTTGSGGTAVFSKSMAGLLTNGQKIGLKAFTGAGGNKLFGGWTVSAFDGDRTCTITPVLPNMWAPAAGTVTGIRFSVSLDGVARIYLNGSKILDVSATALAEGTPPGGDKPWCSASDLSMILTESSPLSTGGVIWLGGNYSSNTATYNTTMLVNVGDGVATNPDTFLWWTRAVNTGLPTIPDPTKCVVTCN